MRNNSTWAPSALSPTNWPREAWNPLLTLLTLVGVVVILFVAQLAYFAVTVFGTHMLTATQLTTSIPPMHLLVLQFVSFAPIALFLLLVLPPLSRSSLAELGFRMPTKRDLAIGALGAIAMTVAVDGSGTLFAALLHRQDTEQAVALLKSLKTPPQQVLFFVLACIFAPLCEELAFRIFIFNALTRYVPIAAAAIVSGILFGLLHLTGGGLQVVTVALPLMIGGVILAYVYASTKCFWANVTTHALFNTISVASYFIFHTS